MCDKVRAEFRCSDTHEERGEDRLRFKHIARCAPAVARGQTCHQDNMDQVHILQEDEADIDCPECRGETPHETP